MENAFYLYLQHLPAGQTAKTNKPNFGPTLQFITLYILLQAFSIECHAVLHIYICKTAEENEGVVNNILS